MSIDDAVPDGVKSWLERITLWRTIRFIGTVGAIAVPIWAWAGNYVTGLADSAVINTLKRKGIDPDSFQGLQAQVKAITESVEELRSEKKDTDDEIKRQQKEIIELLKGRQ